MGPFDVIIIGGGISGTSLAHYFLRAGLKPCLLEKETSVGGALASQRHEGGFWLEMGAHTAYNSYGNFLSILSERRLIEQLEKRQTSRWMLWDDHRAVSIKGRIGIFELIRSLPSIFWTEKSGLTVEGYYSKILGSNNYRNVGRPMFNAVTSQEAGNIPAAMLFKKRPRDKQVMRSFTLKGGLRSVPEAICAMDGLTVRTGCDVKQIGFREGMFQVTEAAGGVLEAPALALATPADAAAGLLGTSFPQLAEKLSNITVREILSIGAVVKKGRVRLPLMAGLVGGDDSFYSMVSRDPVDHPEQRGFTFHFKPDAGREESMETIERILGTPRRDFDHLATRTNRMPSPRPGHGAWVRELDALLAGKSILITGNYFAGLSIEDCVSRSVKEGARWMQRLQAL